MKTLLVISAVVLLASCATIPDSQAAMTAEKYIRGEHIVGILLKEAEEWNEFLEIPIEVRELSYLHLIILIPPEWTGGESNPSSGSWIVRYSLTGAPENFWYNVAFQAIPGGTPHVVPMAMGESLTTRELFDDAIRDVLSAARMKLREDGYEVRIEAAGPWKPVVAYTFLVTSPNLTTGSAAEGAWREKWIVRMNRMDTEVWLDFLPDGEGGTNIVVTVETEERSEGPMPLQAAPDFESA